MPKDQPSKKAKEQTDEKGLSREEKSQQLKEYFKKKLQEIMEREN